MVDLDLNNDDLDFLREIQESNRGEQHSIFQLDSSLLIHFLAASSHGQLESVEQVDVEGDY
jgi:hypothetical protein